MSMNITCGYSCGLLEGPTWAGNLGRGHRIIVLSIIGLNRGPVKILLRRAPDIILVFIARHIWGGFS
jgi:hypothetical protein